jgi:dTMP kinase
MFICVDGLDASGKHTQSENLADRVRAAGREAVVLSFPRYETPVGQAIKRLLTGERAVLKTGSSQPIDLRGGAGVMYETDDADEALVLQALFLLDKNDAITEIVDHLNAGTVVIADRWIPSARCYGAADGLDPDWLERIHFPLLDADLNVFLDVPPAEALRRRPEARDRFERDRDKQARVHQNYVDLWGCGVGGLRIVQTDPYQYFAYVDGLGTVKEVTDRIFQRVVETPAWEQDVEDTPREDTAS